MGYTGTCFFQQLVSKVLKCLHSTIEGLWSPISFHRTQLQVSEEDHLVFKVWTPYIYIYPDVEKYWNFNIGLYSLRLNYGVNTLNKCIYRQTNLQLATNLHKVSKHKWYLAIWNFYTSVFLYSSISTREMAKFKGECSSDALR